MIAVQSFAYHNCKGFLLTCEYDGEKNSLDSILPDASGQSLQVVTAEAVHLCREPR